jgi:type 1 glutamine amidotransferase
MKKQYLFFILAALLLTFFTSCKKQGHYDALIITGQNNHNWKASNPILKQLLDQTGLFTSEIMITPEKGGDMTTFNPNFSKYDLVVLDYNGDPWTAKTDSAFLKFVRKGGGVVVYHAADNAFPDWKEYNKIIGLGGWGNRNEKSGPYVYYRGNEIVRDDTSKGIGGTHGARSEFSVRIRNSEHPITKGLPVNWLHGNDELYSKLRGPAVNMEILATASSGRGGFGRPAVPTPAGAAAVAAEQAAQAARAARTAQQATPAVRNAQTTPGGPNAQAGPRPGQPGAPGAPQGQPGAPGAAFAGGPPRSFQPPRDEPALMTITYGKGRIFHTILGHADEGGGPAMQCVGFIVTYQRGAEWAASGKVTQEVPYDFPSSAGVVIRPEFKEITLDDALANIGNYDISKSTKNLNCIRFNIRKVIGNEPALLDIEKKLVTVLQNSQATDDAKKLLLRELSWMGTDYSVAAIKELASKAELKEEAEFALTRLQAGK